MTQKGDYDTSTKHFYRAMKIAEETGDTDMREQAKVNFGMANASMKWSNHVTSILQNLQDTKTGDAVHEDEDRVEEEDEDDETGVNGGNRLPDINKK